MKVVFAGEIPTRRVQQIEQAARAAADRRMCRASYFQRRGGVGSLPRDQP